MRKLTYSNESRTYLIKLKSCSFFFNSLSFGLDLLCWCHVATIAALAYLLASHIGGETSVILVLCFKQNIILGHIEPHESKADLDQGQSQIALK